jgi:two-component system phosphate regulon sensor histidine kinase PhoR
MLGYIEIIQASKIDQDKKEKFLNKVLNQTNRMNAIIDDLLRLSKIESQEEDSSIELFEMHLAPILEGAMEDVSENSKKSSNRILVHCDDVMVNADAQLLREGIVNLLENAIKYGDNGRDIKIIVEDNDQLYIHIENAGEPILPKYREKIFQRFYRIDKSRDRRAGGTGLGLAIVKHISLVHNGEVLVSDSKTGKCRFTIMLPSVVQQKAQNI